MSAELHSIEQVQRLQSSDSAKMLSDWLDLMEDFEAPRVYLQWSLLTMVGALLGKKSQLTLGPYVAVKPNLFVVLMGPAGVRKSSALNACKRLVEGTTINFGPTDTGGQRHGLMSAIAGLKTRNALLPSNLDHIIPDLSRRDAYRPTTDMCLVVSELGRLLGSASRDMADFLVDVWDGEDIMYQTKSGEIQLRDPLVSMLGATTPSSFASMLPDNAAGHGILTRMLFVYADENHKNVPIAPIPSEKWLAQQAALEEKMHAIDAMNTDFVLSPEAVQEYTRLYAYVPGLLDPRMASYSQRRPTMLLKVAMILAAMRESYKITPDDVLLAHELLAQIEPKMHKSLEYFGRNKNIQGKMMMLEFLRTMKGPQLVTRHELMTSAMSELSNREANDVIESLLSSGELVAKGDRIALATSVNATIPIQR